MDAGLPAFLQDAVPIWCILNITEKEYYIRYPPIKHKQEEKTTTSHYSSVEEKNVTQEKS